MHTLTIQKCIQLSRKNIQLSLDVLADQQVAVEEARRIYSDARGMYKVIQKQAKVIFKTCLEHGLTIDKPYKIIDGRLWGVMHGINGLVVYR